MGIGFTTRVLLRIPLRNDDDNPEFPSNTQLAGFVVRGPRALQPVCYIKRRRIKLIWYNTQLAGFVVRGPRASQPCVISKDVESS